eukprot:COSAG06_NODE_1608_length_8946_cov_17.020685_2_plen_40_part_00
MGGSEALNFDANVLASLADTAKRWRLSAGVCAIAAIRVS